MDERDTLVVRRTMGRGFIAGFREQAVACAGERKGEGGSEAERKRKGRGGLGTARWAERFVGPAPLDELART